MLTRCARRPPAAQGIVEHAAAFEQPVRHMAAIVFANVSVERHWSQRMGRGVTLGALRHRARGDGAGRAREDVDREAREAAEASSRFAAASMSEEEKAHCRAALLHLVCVEEDDLVASQLVVGLARIARMDWPRQWPDVHEQLLACVAVRDDGGEAAAPSDLAAHRAALALHHVLKQKERTAVGRRQLGVMCPALFGAVAAAWGAHMEALLATLETVDWSRGDVVGAAAEELAPHVALARMLYKSLARVSDLGCDELARTDAIAPLLHRLLSWLPTLLGYRHALAALGYDVGASDDLRGDGDGAEGSEGWGIGSGQHPFSTALVSMTHKMVWTPVRLQQKHPGPLSRFVNDLLGFFRERLEAGLGGGSATLPKVVAICCLQFFDNVTSESAYETDESADGPAAALAAFFTPEWVGALLQFVLEWCLPLRRWELAEWDADAEAYVLEQAGATRDGSVRASAEQLFLSLLEHATFSEAVVATLLGYCEKLEPAAVDEGSEDACLALDGAYVAVGCGSYMLQPVWPFESWFHSRLARVLEWAQAPDGAPAELSLPHRVLLRRVLWLVSCWRAEVLESMRPPLYVAVIAALQNSDAAVRLSACSTMHNLVSEWGFQPAAFASCFGPAVEALYAAVAASEETDSRMQLLEQGECAPPTRTPRTRVPRIHVPLSHTRAAMRVRVAVNELVATMGQDPIGRSAVQRSALQVVEPLRGLWDACAEANVVRVPILGTLTNIVSVLAEISAEGGTDSSDGGFHVAQLWPTVLPLIAISTDGGEEESGYLCEEALKLWHAAMDASEEYTADLHALFPALPELVRYELTHIEQVALLLEDYILLGGAALLEHHAGDVAAIFGAALGAVRPAVAKKLGRTMGALVDAFPAQAAEMLRNVLATMLVSAGDSDDSSDVICVNLSVLARVFVHASDFFTELVSQASIASGVAVDEAAAHGFTQVVDMWLVSRCAYRRACAHELEADTAI